jgi:hypothetical protein
MGSQEDEWVSLFVADIAPCDPYSNRMINRVSEANGAEGLSNNPTNPDKAGNMNPADPTAAAPPNGDANLVSSAANPNAAAATIAPITAAGPTPAVTAAGPAPAFTAAGPAPAASAGIIANAAGPNTAAADESARPACAPFTFNPSPGSVEEGSALPPQKRADSVSVSVTNDAEVKQARLRAKLEAQGFSLEEIQEFLDDPEAGEDEEDVFDGGIDGSGEEP